MGIFKEVFVFLIKTIKGRFKKNKHAEIKDSSHRNTYRYSFETVRLGSDYDEYLIRQEGERLQ